MLLLGEHSALFILLHVGFLAALVGLVLSLLSIVVSVVHYYFLRSG